MRMTRNETIKEDLDHMNSDCRRIEAGVSELWRYVNGLYPESIITQGKFFSLGKLVEDLNKHWNSIAKSIKE